MDVFEYVITDITYMIKKVVQTNFQAVVIDFLQILLRVDTGQRKSTGILPLQRLF